MLGRHQVGGEHGEFVGMTGFGASAPAGVLYEKFNITADAIAAARPGWWVRATATIAGLPSGGTGR